MTFDIRHLAPWGRSSRTPVHHTGTVVLSAIPSGLSAHFLASLGGPLRRRLARWSLLLPQIAAFEPELMALADIDLRKRSLSLKYRARSREPLTHILPEAFALVREAGRRTLEMRHFDVQLLGGIAMHHRSIAEMQTGEGKTLTATLPMYLESLVGKGAHLATVNDYLARRDAEWMRPIYQALGVSVGVIEAQMSSATRRKEYACDVTYGTAKEFGFDFLRDRLLERRAAEGMTDLLGGMLGHTGGAGGEKPVQRGAHFALVDEADSILIDEARTPLIISALPTEEERIAAECHSWAAAAVPQFIEDDHYEFDHDKQTVELNADGRQLVRSLPKPKALDSIGLFTMYEYIERAIKVDRVFTLDRHYVVRDGEIVIVDEFTGRLAEGRKWRAGIHQAVEAKEKVEVTVATGQAARVTVQDFFLRYPRLAGMTGTATSSAGELRRIYKLRVVPIPTNRPAIRQRLPERVFGNDEAKWQAIVEEVLEHHASGRPLLIGTRSIDKSEILSRMLTAAKIEHRVLNANKIAEEADIVARAGERGKVTVSTNMAGRGTDIKLGEGIAELGGLHVICTEMHDSARIDRQLIGRCGRQGDPGTWRQYLALDDDILLAGLGPKRAKRLKEQGKEQTDGFDHLGRLFRRAQGRIERKHFRDRRVLMYYEKERKKTHEQMGQDPYLDAPGA
ncbi:MAG: preprotein translocase subunit SecA [Planctomycetia bacterium]|nr:preprotein translocase subunit SecA [Planctomycetia bacterium]